MKKMKPIHKFQDENCVNRPVCSFVKPLRGGRLLESARHAARFVSLMHHQKVEGLGGGSKPEQWSTMHAFLCRNRGVRNDLTALTLGAAVNRNSGPPCMRSCVGTEGYNQLSFLKLHVKNSNTPPKFAP